MKALVGLSGNDDRRWSAMMTALHVAGAAMLATALPSAVLLSCIATVSRGYPLYPVTGRTLESHQVERFPLCRVDPPLP